MHADLPETHSMSSIPLQTDVTIANRFDPPPKFDDMRSAPTAPLLFVARQNLVEQTITSDHTPTALPLNDLSNPIHFSTPLFEGRLAVLIRGLGTQQADHFEGKARKTHIIVQGRFK